MPNSSPLPKLITQQDQLDLLCSAISDQQQIALDTEFMRTSTYAPMLGLLQVKVEDVSVCIDPLAELDMGQTWELLFDPTRSCIIHSAKQDMEVMYFEQGAVVGELIDTQICAALLGHPAQIGYAGLALKLLGISINKSQTRTDWSRRPLSEAQLRYAAEDVEHLPTLLKIMREQLETLGRYDWAREDSAAMLDLTLYKPDPGNAWTRVKSMPFLPVEQQARARALTDWRERRAVASDKPRQWVMSDKALLQIAQENPDDTQTLGRLDEVPAGLANNQGKKLLAIINDANQAHARGDLELRQLTPERDQDKSTLHKLSGLVRARATELNIAAEVLASKRDIQALLRSDANPRVNTGWRKEIIGKELVNAMD
jgi:ribonuclease D